MTHHLPFLKESMQFITFKNKYNVYFSELTAAVNMCSPIHGKSTLYSCYVKHLLFRNNRKQNHQQTASVRQNFLP